MRSLNAKLFRITKEICYRENILNRIKENKEAGQYLDDDRREQITNERELERLRQEQRRLEKKIEEKQRKKS